MNRILIHADQLAELIGFDFENCAWCAEPEQLEELFPGIGNALFDLFKVLHIEAKRDTDF